MTILASLSATLFAPLGQCDSLAGFDVGQHVGAVFLFDSVALHQKRQHFILEAHCTGIAHVPLRVAVHKQAHDRPVVGPHFKLLFFDAFVEFQAKGGEFFNIREARAVNPETNRAL
jgi:hypothetical protein